MYFTSFLVLSASVAAVVGAPFTFPTADGFPRPNRTQLAQIQQGAGGTLSNAFLPASLKSAAITILELLTNNEISEVAFFTELLTNITTNVPGYDAAATAPLDRDYLIKAISAIVNQEKLHALGAEGILAGAGQPFIEPCQYDFPVSNFKEAILLAQTFTDIALGTLPQVQVLFATDGGGGIRNVPLLGSILAQEGQQDGFFRSVQQKTPSAAPYLTGGSASFAFTALQAYIVPGSCPKPLSTINLPTFKSLNIVNKPMAKNMTLEYSVDGKVSCKDQSVVYLSGQNRPVRVPIHCNVTTRGESLEFTADFPFQAGFANGLTIAAVVNGTTGPLLDPNAVAEVTVYAPGLIEVN
ncbi:MAG: hypothetical protein LQ341_005308 [Variospora aurantia]|nr:MAG: hypothetical protein LQ341_005308 [Variospora aurantia]